MYKKLPFSDTEIKNAISKFGTPFHVYDEKGIRLAAKTLKEAFGWEKGFINFFAVKALPNPSVLKLLIDEDMGVDCSSIAELILAENSGFSGEKIMFTGNDTSTDEFIKAVELGAIVNLDDISHIDFLENTVGKLPEILCFRYNPGPERVGNDIIGNPAEAKYGLTKEQLLEAYEKSKSRGVKRFGIHTMLVSNELHPSYFVETALMLFELTVEIKSKLDIDLEFINLGGGFGIPYLPNQEVLDVAKVSGGIRRLYIDILEANNLKPKIFLECGRYVTGPYGFLVSTVLHLKHTYRNYVGLDSSMANLMRPAMYGAYHHMTVLGKENEIPTHIYDVTGSLCENNDKFAIQRPLPGIDVGDIVIIYDTGAHGHAMGFNYNGKLRSAELLFDQNRDFNLIRRAETLADHFSTLKF